MEGRRLSDPARPGKPAPIPVFPVSWQDTGSAVFALAALALVLGFGPLRTGSGGRAALLSALGSFAALVVDIYLY